LNVPGSPENGPLSQRPGYLRQVAGNRNGVHATYERAAISIALLTPTMVRVRLVIDPTPATVRSWSIVREDSSYPCPPVVVADEQDAIRITSAPTMIELARQDARITMRFLEDAIVVGDGAHGGPTWETDGCRRWTKHMARGEHFFGFGERTGLLDKRGRRYTCWTTDEWEHIGPSTDMLYVAIPFFMSVDERGRSYGVFLNNTYRSAFDLTSLGDDRLVIDVDGGQLDYYVIAGPAPADVVEQYTGLIGRAPLPPKWALGYHQSRWSYCPASEVESIAQQFRRRRIPCDALHLDIDHMDGYRVFTWNPSAFPDPDRLAASLRDDGFKLVVIVDAGVKYQPEGGYDVYSDGHARDYFVKRNRGNGSELLGWVWPGRCAFPDHTRPDVRDWWGLCYGRYTRLGIAGFLNDMNEPAMHDAPFDAPGSGNAEPPPDTPFGSTEHATHAEVRNIYALLENRAAYEGLRRLAPDSRPFLMTRAAGAGIQRYAAVWTGDVWSSWEHLEMSLPQLLNLGLSGVPIAGVDVGGFFGHCDDELLARWTQLGAFYPVMRNNSAMNTTPQEPWSRGEAIEQVCRQAIEQRYRLLPYVYTLFEEATRTGAPILRPLFYHYPDDARTHTLHDEALVGRDLLIAPVVRPGRTHRDVYLPEGRWHDVRNGQVYEGPCDILARARLDEGLPLYARGGSIIPFGPVTNWVGERPLDPLTLHVHLDADGRAEGRLYEDDGLSWSHQHGNSSMTSFACATVNARLAIRSAPISHGCRVDDRRVEVILHAAERTWRVDVPAGGSTWDIDGGPATGR
jgi:alpha-glucosidase